MGNSLEDSGECIDWRKESARKCEGDFLFTVSNRLLRDVADVTIPVLRSNTFELREVLRRGALVVDVEHFFDGGQLVERFDGG